MPAKPKQYIKLQSKKMMNSAFVGNFKAAFHGRGVEFQDFRQYSPDDDAKFIDWSISSREGTTIMRRYREEKEGNILCVIENSIEMGIEAFKKRELCEEIISLIGYSAQKSGESFGGYFVQGNAQRFIAPKKNEASIIALISELKQAPEHFSGSYDFLMKRSQKRAVVFIITPRLSSDLSCYSHIAKKHDLILIHIASHFENTLEGQGIYYLRSGKQTLAIDLDDHSKKQKYLSEREELIRNIHSQAHKKGMSFMSLDEKSSLQKEFLQLMKYREGNK